MRPTLRGTADIWKPPDMPAYQLIDQDLENVKQSLLDAHKKTHAEAGCINTVWQSVAINTGCTQRQPESDSGAAVSTFYLWFARRRDCWCSLRRIDRDRRQQVEADHQIQTQP